MPSYSFEIRPAGADAGVCVIGGRELTFYGGCNLDPMTAPLHCAAVNRYVSDGTLSGVVTVEAAGE